MLYFFFTIKQKKKKKQTKSGNTNILKMHMHKETPKLCKLVESTKDAVHYRNEPFDSVFHCFELDNTELVVVT